MPLPDKLLALKYKLYKAYRRLVRLKEHKSRNKFEKRILNRLEAFYNDTYDISFIYRNYKRDMPEEEWKKEKYWQMKLENKLNAKEFVVKYGCQAAELYWKGNVDEFAALDLKSLPGQFTIKPNLGHSSRNIFLMSNGYNFFDSRYYSNDELKTKVVEYFKDKSEVKILIEEFLTDPEGKYGVTWDYKFYTFNGNVALVQVNEKDEETKKISYYKSNWKPLRRKLISNEVTGEPLPKPAHFDQMLEDVKKLSRQYEIFARIDYYDTNRGPVFGEFTPTPRRGKDFTSYASKVFIKYWDTYCKGKI